jgi:hypothetical protein
MGEFLSLTRLITSIVRNVRSLPLFKEEHWFIGTTVLKHLIVCRGLIVMGLTFRSRDKPVNKGSCCSLKFLCTMGVTGGVSEGSGVGV